MIDIIWVVIEFIYNSEYIQDIFKILLGTSIATGFTFIFGIRLFKRQEEKRIEIEQKIFITNLVNEIRYNLDQSRKFKIYNNIIGEQSREEQSGKEQEKAIYDITNLKYYKNILEKSFVKGIIFELLDTEPISELTNITNKLMHIRQLYNGYLQHLNTEKKSDYSISLMSYPILMEYLNVYVYNNEKYIKIAKQTIKEIETKIG